MKKMFSLLAVITTPFVAHAQGGYSSDMEEEIFKVGASIIALGLFMIFSLVILKRMMDYRIKKRIIEKGIPENVALSILKTNPKEDQNANIKWFAVLTGTGVGLTIIYYTLPVGIHSLAIMAFSIAVSFLGYYFFVRYTDK